MAIINGPMADPTIVRDFTNRLLEEFDAYIDAVQKSGIEITYVEGFMAAHNFHVQVIESLVVAAGDPIWRSAAKTTFENRMDNPGQQDTKVGGYNGNE